MTKLNISGVLPNLAVKADHVPDRSETGIGALMPWANRLWFVTYVAHKAGTGGGTGLFTVDDEMNLTKHPASVVGTYANRMIHHETNTCLIGPHVIDAEGHVETLDELVHTRLTATCRHLTDPANKVYTLGMEGELFEVTIATGQVEKVADVVEELYVSGQGPAHFKSAFCRDRRLVIANNSYYHKDYDTPDDCDGRLAEFDGETWTLLEKTQFNTVGGHVSGELGRAIYAVGQDRASAILRMYRPETGWQRYRLPKATGTQDHAWTTEWPRIREIESERFLLDASGMFYELPAMTYGGRLRHVRPVASHLRIVGDFCSWNGMLVLAGDQTTPIHDINIEAGQPQANLWFGKSDDLWQFGPRTGWGGPWYQQAVAAGEPSDPFLMTGFVHKCLHVSSHDGSPTTVHVEVDFTGDGEFHACASLDVAAGGYACHTFPEGFSADWVRLVSEADATLTARFHYT